MAIILFVIGASLNEPDDDKKTKVFTALTIIFTAVSAANVFSGNKHKLTNGAGVFPRRYARQSKHNNKY
jgi:hypothetical protein